MRARSQSIGRLRLCAGSPVFLDVQDRVPDKGWREWPAARRRRELSFARDRARSRIEPLERVVSAGHRDGEGPGTARAIYEILGPGIGEAVCGGREIVLRSHGGEV